MKKITIKSIQKFKKYLENEEKSSLTLEKYIRDVSGFMSWVNEENIDKGIVLKYKQVLMEKYTPSTANSIISALNSFFIFKEWFDCKVKTIKMQKKIFADNEKELTKAEYERLLTVAKDKKNKNLYMLMQTICSTGIRVSELKFITVEAVKKKQATINCKGKMRVIIIPKQLCKMLSSYIKKKKILDGSVFISKNGNPLDRSNIWSDMKKLCKSARVSKEKVFPHNLRHLFARTYYTLQKDIVRLADILGHSSVNTTRIYTMETGEVHRQQLQRLGLLMC